MRIELLTHHVKPAHPMLEAGVFDGWEEKSLKPTMKAVQKNVTPHLKEVLDPNGKPQYPFLTSSPQQKHKFEKRFLKCYKAFLKGDYVEVPDYDPESLKHNKGHLCEACPNWQSECQHKRLDGSQKQYFNLIRLERL